MPRPRHRRRVRGMPPCACFKPAGIPARQLESITLSVDEYEAFRLADFEGLYQEQVAERMGVSRQTVGRILQCARGKVAEALALGKALRIEGGDYTTGDERLFGCRACGHRWSEPFGTGRPMACPACEDNGVRRLDDDTGR